MGHVSNTFRLIEMKKEAQAPRRGGPGRETESQIARQIDREPDSQADRQTDRQTDRHGAERCAPSPPIIRFAFGVYKYVDDISSDQTKRPEKKPELE